MASYLPEYAESVLAFQTVAYLMALPQPYINIGFNLPVVSSGYGVGDLLNNITFIIITTDITWLNTILDAVSVLGVIVLIVAIADIASIG